ncbi:hypothetical protein I6N96_07985 [Enterococcus sp. BWM-S5]|uniref:Uncharacterized protein n=1 Tax=Enterococcus larvae TaxID=2794352 RepID=A0ABS4CI37_9ENTE|nr:hypothetical protein [Enterococcus larvae]MBP1046221.1 hypothetical protein [Enterococcus larvae]
MSQTIEQLEDQYLKRKQQYETKIDDLRFAKYQAVRILEEVAQFSEHYTKTITDDLSAFHNGLRELDHLGDEFQDNCQKEMRKLDNELEDIEATYRRDYQRLSEQASKAEEDTSE